MSLLLLVFSVLLHAETATYSVTSYHDIALSDGVAPEGSWVTFNNTTARGSQITTGNSATLTFSGFDGLKILSLSLQMRSNQSSGGGSLTLLLGMTEIASIPTAPFADAVWNGSFSTEWVNVTVPLQGSFTVGEGVTFTIIVEAATNSLYVGGCTVTYYADDTPLLPMTVGFYTGTEESISPVTEVRGGKGVLLPALQDADSVWHFLGWTEAPLPHTDVCPAFYRAGEQYFPKKNTTLYALYTNKLSITPLVQDTLPESGVYALVSAAPYNCMMAGGVEDKKVGSSAAVPYLGPDSLYYLSMETIPQENRYSIQFTTDSTATIKHVASNRFIGYNPTGHYLQAVENEWIVLRTAEHSVLFCHSRSADGLLWGLFPSMKPDGILYADTKLRVRATDLTMLLFAVPDHEPVRALYTTNPRSGLGLQVVKENVFLRVFRPDGTYVMTATAEEELRNLPRGMYIICSPHGAQKRIVR